MPQAARRLRYHLVCYIGYMGEREPRQSGAPEERVSKQRETQPQAPFPSSEQASPTKGIVREPHESARFLRIEDMTGIVREPKEGTRYLRIEYAPGVEGHGFTFQRIEYTDEGKRVGAGGDDIFIPNGAYVELDKTGAVCSDLIRQLVERGSLVREGDVLRGREEQHGTES